MAHGQLALIVGATATALCWALHQLTSSSPRYTWTGSEWLWLAGIIVGIVQIVPLPDEWLMLISPRIKQALPVWFDQDFLSIVSAKWNQLSLAPWETASGLATFVSYAMLFLVMAQRTQTLEDIEQMLCGAALAAVAMMLFAQIQLQTSNGMFFWVYEHPFMTTESYPLGCFTNRNHLAQFLALGTAPLIWWLLRRLHQQELDRADRRAMPSSMHALILAFLLAGAGGIALTVLMTLSRGGLMALALTSSIAIGLMCRMGLASVKFGLAILAVGIVTSGLVSFSKYESILATRLEQNSGRQEIWQANIKVARDFPWVGTGIGTHADAYQMRFESKEDDGLEYSHAECGYLQIASESGLAGLIVAGLVIVTGFWWCLGSLRSLDAKTSSAGAVVLASLVGNVSHAVVDFFWYTPSCMLLLALQLACATRLYRLTREDAGRTIFSFRLPRLVTALAICGLAAIGVWMWDLKFPTAMAEPHRIQALILERADERDLSADERAKTNQLRLQETIIAAKLDPRDAKLQEAATTAYMQIFELKQEQAENSMSTSMLRDVVKASKFETIEGATDWLKRAVGANLKLLRIASRTVRRSLANSPLRARSYVQLTELGFLERIDDANFQTRCLRQALKLRPGDSETLYLVGKSAMQEGDLEKALVYWRPAFERSRQIQEQIADVLAATMTPEFFEKEFHPDWKALEIITKAFAKTGREFEALQIQRSYIERGLAWAKTRESDKDLEMAMISMGNTCRELGDHTTAAEVLSYAVKRFPHCLSIRYMLGRDLMAIDRLADAAEHLQWCASRDPGNVVLQKMATKAVAERLKQAPAFARKDHKVEQTGLIEETDLEE